MSNGSTNLKGLLVGNGRYQVGNLLGQGGMADVYKARDLNLQTDVVVKIPKPQILQDVEFKGRFDREIRALVELQHPHIIKVNDYGLHNGAPFFVMPYMGGGNLDDRRPRDGKNYLPMQLAQFKSWVEPIADALDFIYRKNFAHRDIKPENILFDQNDNVYVSDLGIAKALGKNTAEQQQAAMTKTGMVIGTPEYMAPELIMGKDYDGRVDQYALAVLIYELLAGRVPFKGNNATATLVKHTTEQVPPVTVFNPNLPPHVWGALQKALAKQQEGRFQTCRELTNALYQSAAAHPSAGIIAPKPRGKRAVCPFCNGPFIVPPGSMDKALQCPRCKKIIPKPTAGTPPPLTPPPPSVARHVQSPPAPVPAVPAAQPPRGVSQINVRQRRTITVKPKKKGWLLWTCIALGLFLVGGLVFLLLRGSGNAESQIAEGDRNLYENGAYDAAMTSYSKAIDDNPQMTLAHSKRGDLYALLGDYGDALDDHKKAVAVGKDKEVALTYRGLTHERMGNLSLALKDFDAAIDNNPDYGMAYWARSHLFARSGELKKAADDAKKAISNVKAKDPEGYYHRASANILLGAISNDNSLFERAFDDCKGALKENPKYLPAILARSWVQMEKGNGDAALSDSESATENHSKLPAVQFNLARAYVMTNRTDKAIAALDKAIELNRKDVWAYVERALLREKDGDLKNALNDLNTAVSINTDFAHGYLYRAFFHMNRFHNDNALNDLDRAIQLYPNFAAAYRLRGYVHIEKNRRDQAIADFRRVLDLDPDDHESRSQLNALN